MFAPSNAIATEMNAPISLTKYLLSFCPGTTLTMEAGLKDVDTKVLARLYEFELPAEASD